MPGFNKKILNVEWLNSNAMRAYPLADAATETNTTGDFTLPRDFLVDMVFPINAELLVDPAGFYVSNVSVFGHGVTVTFSYTDGGTPEIVGTLSVSETGHTLNNSYFVPGQNLLENSIGVVTVGSLETILKIGGSFDFSLDGGRLLPTVMRPDIRGVTSVQVMNDAEASDKLYGDIILEAGRNMRLTVYEVGPDQYIRLDALKGSELNEDCGCSNAADLGPPIRSINGVVPASDGSFTLVPGTCISIAPGDAAATLVIDDTCSKPCCGTPELDVVRQDLAQLDQDSRGILHFLQQVEQHLQQLEAVKAAIQNAGVLGDNDSVENPI